MSERRKPTHLLNASGNRLRYDSSGVEMNEMFAGISRAKETVAQSITEQQRKEDERKRGILNKLFSKNTDAISDMADTAVDDELAEIERKLALVRAGELHEYDVENSVEENGDALDERSMGPTSNGLVTDETSELRGDADRENAELSQEFFELSDSVPDENEERKSEPTAENERESERDSDLPDAVLKEDDFVVNQPEVLAGKRLEGSGPAGEDKPELDLDLALELELEFEPVIDASAPQSGGASVFFAGKEMKAPAKADVIGYFAAASGETGHVGYLYMLNPTKGVHNCAPKVIVTDSKSLTDIIFEGAVNLLNDIEKLGCSTAVVHMDDAIREQLVNSVSVFGFGGHRNARSATFTEVAMRVSRHCEIDLCDGRQMVARKTTQINCESWIRSLVNDDNLWGDDYQFDK